jgi:hypothetical protein
MFKYHPTYNFSKKPVYQNTGKKFEMYINHLDLRLYSNEKYRLVKFLYLLTKMELSTLKRNIIKFDENYTRLVYDGQFKIFTNLNELELNDMIKNILNKGQTNIEKYCAGY